MKKDPPLSPLRISNHKIATLVFAAQISITYVASTPSKVSFLKGSQDGGALKGLTETNADFLWKKPTFIRGLRKFLQRKF